MNYQQIQPPDYLQQYVRYFWVSESNGDPSLSHEFSTLPDGGPGLVFQNPDKGRYYQFGGYMSSFFLYGQSTRHALVKLNGSFSTIGAHFYPHALKSVFGLDAIQLTNTCIELEASANRQGFFLTEQLSADKTLPEKIEILSSYLFYLVRKNELYEDPAMNYVLKQIVQARGNVSMQQLQDELRFSERNMERKFRQYIGVTPKLFTRICRFQASLTQLRNNQFDKLSDIAYENEYADQSHLIRSFKEFAGVSPNQFHKQSGSATEQLANISASDPLVGAILFYGLK